MGFYSFDTSSLLNGRRDLLPPDTFPGVWTNIEVLIQAGDIRCVDIVRDELKRREDSVYRWARSQPDLFVPLELDLQAATKRILARHPLLLGRGRGRNGADPFVIALATLHKVGVVVTEETPSGNINNPRIPDVCDAMGVPHTNLIGFINRCGWTF